MRNEHELTGRCRIATELQIATTLGGVRGRRAIERPCDERSGGRVRPPETGKNACPTEMPSHERGGKRCPAVLKRRDGLPASAVFGLLLLTLLLAPGCVSKDEKKAQRAVSDYLVGDYRRAMDDLKAVARKKDENFVLNNLRLGSAALANYDYDEAEAAFLNAYEVINSVGVNDGGRSLGAVLVSEKLRVWKGEPYERAMANFYLGLIYSERHDYNNARAAFENALFKLRDYTGDKDAKDQYRNVESNFALGSVMLARTYQRLGREDLAKATFDRLAELDPQLAGRGGRGGLADPEVHRGSNVLLVIDYGYGPRKQTNFDGMLIGFSPTPAQQGPVAPVRVNVDGRDMNVGPTGRPPVDLLAMAQDRKWQDIDTIRTIKSLVGTGLMVAGGVEGIRGATGHGSAQRRDLIAGAALMGAGLLLKATSQADVRQWEMLPRTVLLVPLRLPPGRHDVTVDFPAVAGLTQTWRDVDVPAEGEVVHYIKMQRYSRGTREWPGSGGNDK